jgi:hypothetical protein
MRSRIWVYGALFLLLGNQWRVDAQELEVARLQRASEDQSSEKSGVLALSDREFFLVTFPIGALFVLVTCAIAMRVGGAGRKIENDGIFWTSGLIGVATIMAACVGPKVSLEYANLASWPISLVLCASLVFGLVLGLFHAMFSVFRMLVRLGQRF